MKLSFPCLQCFCSTSDDKKVHKNDKGGENPSNFRLFSYHDLKAATDGFSSWNNIGEGRFGSVYKGRLTDGTIVAIKMLYAELESMKDEHKFISEIAALSDIHHENLVTLHGCCVEGAKRCLVYDYIENTSLSHQLFGEEQNRNSFNWSKRKNASLGVAKALEYLHEKKKPHIIHRDIKASNVLLDHHLNPKVIDFGLLRLFQDDATGARISGTLGYTPPEYAILGRLTRKSDVYSFGVLLLEIVTGRPVVDNDKECCEQFLVDNVWDMYNCERLVEMMDHVLLKEDDYHGLREEVVQFLKIGLLCVQETPKLRPRMSEVIKMLTGENSVEGVKISHPGFVTQCSSYGC